MGTKTVRFDSVKSVADILRVIGAESGRLQFAGKNLVGDRLITEYNIQKDSTLHLLARGRGGSGKGIPSALPSTTPMLRQRLVVASTDADVPVAPPMTPRQQTAFTIGTTAYANYVATSNLPTDESLLRNVERAYRLHLITSPSLGEAITNALRVSGEARRFVESLAGRVAADAFTREYAGGRALAEIFLRKYMPLVFEPAPVLSKDVAFIMQLEGCLARISSSSEKGQTAHSSSSLLSALPRDAELLLPSTVAPPSELSGGGTSPLPTTALPTSVPPRGSTSSLPIMAAALLSEMSSGGVPSELSRDDGTLAALLATATSCTQTPLALAIALGNLARVELYDFDGGDVASTDRIASHSVSKIAFITLRDHGGSVPLFLAASAVLNAMIGGLGAAAAAVHADASPLSAGVGLPVRGCM
jgi:hypothetical protein